METISSKDNHLIKEYVRLTSSKKQRENTGLFAIEGIKLVEEAFIQSVPLEMAFITEGCLQKCALNTQMQKLFQTVRTIIITEQIADKLSEQNTPQGIFAVARRNDKTLTIDSICGGGKYIMLCDLQDPGNTGAIIRTAEALGIDGVLMTSSCCDPYSPKVIRGSMGSSLRLSICIVEDMLSTLSELRENGVFTYAGVVRTDATDIKSVSFRDSSVMLIGNEGNGLPVEVQNACDCLVTIQMSGKAESLNASMAACILMWEMQSH